MSGVSVSVFEGYATEQGKGSPPSERSSGAAPGTSQPVAIPGAGSRGAGVGAGAAPGSNRRRTSSGSVLGMGMGMLSGAVAGIGELVGSAGGRSSVPFSTSSGWAGGGRAAVDVAPQHPPIGSMQPEGGVPHPWGGGSASSSHGGRGGALPRSLGQPMSLPSSAGGVTSAGGGRELGEAARRGLTGEDAGVTSVDRGGKLGGNSSSMSTGGLRGSPGVGGLGGDGPGRAGGGGTAYGGGAGGLRGRSASEQIGHTGRSPGASHGGAGAQSRHAAARGDMDEEEDEELEGVSGTAASGGRGTAATPGGGSGDDPGGLGVMAPTAGGEPRAPSQASSRGSSQHEARSHSSHHGMEVPGIAGSRATPRGGRRVSQDMDSESNQVGAAADAAAAGVGAGAGAGAGGGQQQDEEMGPGAGTGDGTNARGGQSGTAGGIERPQRGSFSSGWSQEEGGDAAPTRGDSQGSLGVGTPPPHSRMRSSHRRNSKTGGAHQSSHLPNRTRFLSSSEAESPAFAPATPPMAGRGKRSDSATSSPKDVVSGVASATHSHRPSPLAGPSPASASTGRDRQAVGSESIPPAMALGPAVHGTAARQGDPESESQLEKNAVSSHGGPAQGHSNQRTAALTAKIHTRHTSQGSDLDASGSSGSGSGGGGVGVLRQQASRMTAGEAQHSSHRSQSLPTSGLEAARRASLASVERGAGAGAGTGAQGFGGTSSSFGSGIAGVGELIWGSGSRSRSRSGSGSGSGAAAASASESGGPQRRGSGAGFSRFLGRITSALAPPMVPVRPDTPPSSSSSLAHHAGPTGYYGSHGHSSQQ